MKEKEVDAYLSLATLGQLLFLGCGGALGSEIFSERPRFAVELAAASVGFIAFISLIILYARIFETLNNKNQK